VNLEEEVVYLRNRITELEHRRKKKKSVVLVKTLDDIDHEIIDAIAQVKHVMLTPELLTTVDILAVMGSISENIHFTSVNMLNKYWKSKVRQTSHRIAKLGAYKSCRISAYVKSQDGDPGYRTNSTVWVVRNFEKYERMTTNELNYEYQNQRFTANHKYIAAINSLGWRREDYPGWQWFFPTTHGPIKDEVSFM
jgi:hypothetical protein